MMSTKTLTRKVRLWEANDGIPLFGERVLKAMVTNVVKACVFIASTWLVEEMIFHDSRLGQENPLRGHKCRISAFKSTLAHTLLLFLTLLYCSFDGHISDTGHGPEIRSIMASFAGAAATLLS